MKIIVSFDHGLGDMCNFGRLLKVYQKYGINVDVNTTQDKEFIVKAAKAVPTKTDGYFHGWWFPGDSIDTESGSNKGWKGNKPGCNMRHFGLNSKNQTMDNLWKDYKSSNIESRECIAEKDWKYIEDKIKDWPRPIVLWHSIGNTSSGAKSFNDQQQIDFITSLLTHTDGTVCILDWDSRIKWTHHNRLKNSYVEFDRDGLNLPRLAALMYQSNLFIGIDSGPFHFSTLTDIPSVCVFFSDIHPSECVVPCERALSITTGGKSKNLDPSKRFEFQLIDLHLNMDEIAKWSLRMIGDRRYLPNNLPIAADAQLQQIIELKCRGNSGISKVIDRNRSFDKLLRECLKRFIKPNFVETGCIRQDEDWNGSGFSTALFSRYCNLTGGKLTSFDTNLGNVEYARRWCRQFGDSVEIIQSIGENGINSFSGKIDVLYLDSLDTDSPGYQDCNLKEFKVALPKLHDKSLVLIDDTPTLRIGKGVKTVEYALKNGWRILYAGYQILLERVL